MKECRAAGFTTEGYRLSGTGEGKWRGGHGESDKILTGEIAVGGSGRPLAPLLSDQARYWAGLGCPEMGLGSNWNFSFFLARSFGKRGAGLPTDRECT